MQPRVVVTGLGSITPLGLNTEAMWQAVLEGKSGISTITRFDADEYASKIAAEVKNYNPEDYFEKKEIRHIDHFAQYAIISAREAIKHSQIDLDSEDRDRIGVIVGSGIGGILSFETEMKKLLNHGPRRISPYFIPQMISDIAAGYISMEFRLKGPNYATVSACATSGHAIGAATMAIQRGDADVMICGGAESAITPMAIGGFVAMKALSTSNENPAKASRPFDLNRDGFVMGEGAGIVVLESLEHAQKRGAEFFSEIGGIGFTADAFHITQPAPGGEGAIRAMNLCLQDGNLQTTDVDYINAHGTSTPYNDKNETAAIKTVFGEHTTKMAISSTKSMTGHMLGAAGAVEFIISALAIQGNIVPPTINYETPDPECDLNYTPNKPVKKDLKVAISNTFGFGGHNACMCLKKYE